MKEKYWSRTNDANSTGTSPNLQPSKLMIDTVGMLIMGDSVKIKTKNHFKYYNYVDHKNVISQKLLLVAN